MTIQEVANRLVAYCREGKFDTAQKELYADDATSIEPSGSPGFKSVTGKDKIIEKGHQFQTMIEQVHSSSISEPNIAGDFFSIAILFDVTLKGMGRVNMDEIAVYCVKEGKVISEHFFYSTM
jgi:hypothetical protein